VQNIARVVECVREKVVAHVSSQLRRRAGIAEAVQMLQDVATDHTFIHKWNEPSFPYSPSRRPSPPFGRYSFFPSH